MLLTSLRIRITVLAALLMAGCAEVPSATAPAAQATSRIEIAFSPEAGAEALVLKVIGSARQTVRLAGYTFTSPSVVRALIGAKERGVDVQVLVDDKGNRGRSNLIAMKLVADNGIPIRTIAAYAINHDKYIVVDDRTTQTGSFNYSQSAARSNSENVLVAWNDPGVAATYLAHWQSRWAQGNERRD